MAEQNHFSNFDRGPYVETFVRRGSCLKIFLILALDAILFSWAKLLKQLMRNICVKIFWLKDSWVQEERDSLWNFGRQSTRYTAENSHGLQDIQTDILKLYIIIQDSFFGISGQESEFQGLDLVYSKRIKIIAVKKTKWQEKQSVLRFVSTFCKSLTSLCQILA